jgi:hypothetical protein
MNITSTTSLLVFLARINPDLWEIIFPHVPRVSEGTRNVMASMIIKNIAREIDDQKVSERLHDIAKPLFDSGTKSMVYEIDDWCPTRPKPIPGWPHHSLDLPSQFFSPQPEPWRFSSLGDELMLNPQPLPPKEKNSRYGALLTLLAESFSTNDVANDLREMGRYLLDAPAERF